jgi:hypothetical protein
VRHIRSSLTTDAAKTIAVAIVGSRLDYFNSLLASTSASNLVLLAFRWFRTPLLELLHKSLGTATSRQFWPAYTGSQFAIESVCCEKLRGRSAQGVFRAHRHNFISDIVDIDCVLIDSIDFITSSSTLIPLFHFPG